ncbi:MAG: hypothetical protein KBF99_05660 [Leptospiraceae bacterium]|nr:hypothetical protein [Leptospiraceae bacterium]MBL0265589.1 hypothetical protein [Leptospiraceae bacterium]MBP9162646.1 hypothetical protein [Leptospiraceae bacterium]
MAFLIVSDNIIGSFAMSDTSKRVLERSQTGEYEFTPYGEFLSYYHAHLQIFNKFIQEKPIPQKERDQLYQRIKGYMVANVKKSDHFFEKIGDFASFLQMDMEELKRHLNESFIEVLTKVQDKLREQEMDKLSSKKDFAHITEELVFKLGEIFPPNCRFALRDGLLVIENVNTGEIVKPVGMLGAIKEEQQKAQEKLAARVVNRPKEPVFVPEKSILVEIFEKHEETLTGERLELKQDFLPEISEPDPADAEPPKEKGLLDDVEELDFEMEEEERPSYDSQDTSSNEPGLLDDIEGFDFQETQRTQEVTEESAPTDDLMDFLDSVGPSEPEQESEPELDYQTEPELQTYEEPEAEAEPESYSEPEMEAEPEPEPEEPDQAELFTFKEYSEITKKIQNYKTSSDTTGYNQWIAGATDLEKCFVSIRANFNKEQTGQPVDWQKYFDSVASKTQLRRETIEKFKGRVKHLDFTKAVLDIAIKELKNQSPEVISILKSAWPHILATFSDAPDYDTVESNLVSLLARLKSDSQRLPIQTILIKGIQKLRQKL